MPEFETLKFARSGSITSIVLDRPDAANGLNDTMTRELAEAAVLCDDDATKVVTLTGAGRFFSAGGDLKAMAGAPSAGAYVKAMADDLHRAMSILARMDAVLITAVNGVAAGAGFPLGVSGDLVLAGESASFTMAYTKVGLSPDGSSSYLLPRLVGLRRTQELMITNRVLSAAEALDWGLVTAVVPDVEVGQRTRRAGHPRRRRRQVVELRGQEAAAQHYGADLEGQLDLEARLIAENADGTDGTEGIAAFLGKRKPDFTG